MDVGAIVGLRRGKEPSILGGGSTGLKQDNLWNITVVYTAALFLCVDGEFALAACMCVDDDGELGQQADVASTVRVAPQRAACSHDLPGPATAPAQCRRCQEKTTSSPTAAAHPAGTTLQLLGGPNFVTVFVPSASSGQQSCSCQLVWRFNTKNKNSHSS